MFLSLRRSWSLTLVRFGQIASLNCPAAVAAFSLTDSSVHSWPDCRLDSVRSVESPSG
jgi:hypothetical protein